jgi:hypothetical protein
MALRKNLRVPADLAGIDLPESKNVVPAAHMYWNHRTQSHRNSAQMALKAHSHSMMDRKAGNYLPGLVSPSQRRILKIGPDCPEPHYEEIVGSQVAAV